GASPYERPAFVHFAHMAPSRRPEGSLVRTAHMARPRRPEGSLVRTAPMRGLHLSSAALRRLTLVNVVLLAALIVSGAVVRLTNSGPGCADWPNCSAT